MSDLLPAQEQPEVATPDEWSQRLGITVHGPDGWRRDGKPWSEPITKEEFQRRVAWSSREMPVQKPEPHLIMTDPTRDAGPCDCPVGMDHTSPAVLPRPLNSVLAEKIQKYGLARCVYAAAHDIEPWTVDETDGGYGDVCELISEDWNATLEPLALALGMPDDSDYAAILQRVAKLAREVSS